MIHLDLPRQSLSPIELAELAGGIWGENWSAPVNRAMYNDTLTLTQAVDVIRSGSVVIAVPISSIPSSA